MHQTLNMLFMHTVCTWMSTFSWIKRHSDLVCLLQGTVFPAEEFDAEAAAAGMRDAMTGFGECTWTDLSIIL